MFRQALAIQFIVFLFIFALRALLPLLNSYAAECSVCTVGVCGGGEKLMASRLERSTFKQNLKIPFSTSQFSYSDDFFVDFFVERVEACKDKHDGFLSATHGTKGLFKLPF